MKRQAKWYYVVRIRDGEHMAIYKGLAAAKRGQALFDDDAGVPKDSTAYRIEPYLGYGSATPPKGKWRDAAEWWSKQSNPALDPRREAKAWAYVHQLQQQEKRPRASLDNRGAYAEDLLRFYLGRSHSKPALPYFMDVYKAHAIRVKIEKILGIYSAKGKHHNPDSGVALTILQQLGGRRFIAMTGSHTFVDHHNALSMQLARNRSGATHLKITLTPADVYTMEFGKLRGSNYQVLIRVEDVYAEQLQTAFTRVTGLDTHL
jgi:hypothetical protein